MIRRCLERSGDGGVCLPWRGDTADMTEEWEASCDTRILLELHHSTRVILIPLFLRLWDCRLAGAQEFLFSPQKDMKCGDCYLQFGWSSENRYFFAY
jgi:hypothetical protein